MLFSSQLKTYSFNNNSIDIYVPDEEAIQQVYTNNKNDAYWAQVWPASIGLCQFFEQYPHYIDNKSILELAAGLGLSGLYAAKNARSVYISDREPLASQFVKKSAQHLKLTNVTALPLNWKDAPGIPCPEVVLLSDVNYEPAVFEELRQVLQFFLDQKVQIIISTPQRLVAKEFIMELLPYNSLQWNNTVTLHGKETGVSIFVLEKNSIPSYISRQSSFS